MVIDSTKKSFPTSVTPLPLTSHPATSHGLLTLSSEAVPLPSYDSYHYHDQGVLVIVNVTMVIILFHTYQMSRHMKQCPRVANSTDAMGTPEAGKPVEMAGLDVSMRLLRRNSWPVIKQSTLEWACLSYTELAGPSAETGWSTSRPDWSTPRKLNLMKYAISQKSWKACSCRVALKI